MEFTKREKEIIQSIIQKHLEEVESVEKNPGQEASEFAAEVKYVQALKGIIEKVEK